MGCASKAVRQRSMSELPIAHRDGVTGVEEDDNDDNDVEVAEEAGDREGDGGASGTVLVPSVSAEETKALRHN